MEVSESQDAESTLLSRISSMRLITMFRGILFFVVETLQRTVSPRIKFSLLLKQMEFVGNRSVAVVLMAGMMIGAVFGLQFGEIFKIFGAESLIGASAAYALCRELAPVICAFLVTARGGSAMAAEIATMRVNEQIDAMQVMAVNPYNYLVAPRVWASVLMLPLLTILFVIAGVISAYTLGIIIYDVDQGIFMAKIQQIVKPLYVWQGLEKAAIFGAVLSLTGCYKGFHAAGGAKGVGRATTQAVVVSLVSILILDFFISYIQYNQALNAKA